MTGDRTPPLRGTLARLSERLPDPLFYRVIARQHRSLEPEMRLVPEMLPPMACAVDVGAWWGPWTYWLSRRASRVIAIEPQPRLAAFLERVTPADVEVVHAALSDETGSAELTVPSARRGQDALASIEPHVEGERITVPLRRLDDLTTDAVGFVKIDVEGHELAVLRGAQATINRCHPTLFVEIEQRHLDHPIADSFEEIRSLGYEGHFWLDREWRSLEAFDVNLHQLDLLDEVKSPRYVNNFLFVSEHDRSGLARRLAEHPGR